jgi:HD-GYP domain-containing protein (c-di-GMP phosphodiesterase class II)
MQTLFAPEPHIEDKLLDLSARIDAFEGYDHAHGLRIAEIAEKIGQSFNMTAHDLLIMQQSSLMHDLGELAMDRRYVRENRALTEIERLDMQRHSVIGEQEAAKRGLPRAVQLLIRWHHEWWNGDGYPDRLEGSQIPLAARIIRVADTYAALTDNRPRRNARPSGEARQYLREWAGIEFDPKVVQAFLAIPEID